VGTERMVEMKRAENQSVAVEFTVTRDLVMTHTLNTWQLNSGFSFNHNRITFTMNDHPYIRRISSGNLIVEK
jgi:hypothetical protein